MRPHSRWHLHVHACALPCAAHWRYVMNIARLTGLILAIVLFAAACSDSGGGVPGDETPEPESLGIEISATATEVGKGGVVELAATLVGGDINDADLIWTADIGEFDDNVVADPMWFAPVQSASATITVSATLNSETVLASETINITNEEAEWCATNGDMNDQDNPCVIYTVQQLEAIGADEDRMAGHYILGRDIDGAETASWDDNRGFAPIGSKTPGNNPKSINLGVHFSGALDGNGFVIRNLIINRPDEVYGGLFAVSSEEAEIHDLVLKDVKVTGYRHVGALVGNNSGSIANINVLRGEVTADRGLAGGLIGHNAETGQIKHIKMQEQTVVALGNSGNGTEPPYAAGVVGRTRGDVVNVLVQNADISGPSAVGGLTAYAYKTSGITYSVVMSSTLASTGSSVGGLAGYGFGDIAYSSARANEIAGDSTVGGAVGHLQGSINQTFVYAPDNAITGQGDNVGGLVGLGASRTTSNAATTISQSYSYVGEIRGDTAVGGLAGNISDKTEITESAAFGKELAGSQTGGLIASNGGDPSDNVQNSYYLNVLSGNSAGGTPLSAQEIIESGSYNWSIGPDEDWVMPSSDHGPLAGPDLLNNSRYDDPAEEFEGLFDNVF